ncbi:TylF/MycF/NovP-related O-methyltransferase [Mucilaginibacter sp.]|uniref:TylF/MycF/NovP-related O-methyltransferase n=1 Tax=Mucilaginibacter sp. TaxID=1882438 RepID=UPI0032665CC4
MLTFLFKLLGIKHNVMNNRIVAYLLKKQEANRHLVNYEPHNELQKQYIQFLPDKYAANLKLYQTQQNFFDYKDISKWTSGFYENNAGDLARFFGLNLCIDQLLEEGITGDIAELGVFKGNSAFLLAKFARLINSQCYLFDTFEGFDDRDFEGNAETRFKQDFSGTSLNSVKELVGTDNTVYVQGFFPNSLQQINELEGLSLVHIDCDLGAPFKAALEYFYPRLKKGGFLIMHDYSSLFWPSAKEAIDEYFKDKPEFVIPIPDKSGSCIIRKV